MNNELDEKAMTEIDETELETIAVALLVRTGLQAGGGTQFQPCI